MKRKTLTVAAAASLAAVAIFAHAQTPPRAQEGTAIVVPDETPANAPAVAVAPVVERAAPAQDEASPLARTPAREEPSEAAAVPVEAAAQTEAPAQVEAPTASVVDALTPQTDQPQRTESSAAAAGQDAVAEPAASESASVADAPAPAAQSQTLAPNPAPAPALAPAPAMAASPSAQPSETDAAVAAPAPSPVQVALREEVRRMLAAPIARAAAGQTPAAGVRREREAIAAFYEARAYAPLWIDGEGFRSAARAAIARLERARDDGLDIAQYPLPTATVATVTEAMAAAEIALSQAVVGYARQASGGRLDPRSIGRLITAKPETVDPADALARAAASADPAETISAFNPPHPGYRALRESLAQVRRERPAVARQKIEPGPALKVGMSDPRVPLVRARFGIDAARDAASGELVYDTRVASAVADFQRANGIPATGVLTARTIAALSGGDASRLEAEIIANMERWRWVPRDLGATRIEVNIPDFQVKFVRDGEVAHRARAIVGKPETQTPVFSDTMEFMVVNPSWHVPQSIIRKQLAQDPNYYARNGFEVVRKGGNVFVRQPPGERNALGHIKFMFPNDHAVYLHDTPNRNLFNAQRRAYSAGCVRVDQPFRLAEALLAPQDWNEQRLRALVGKGERTIRLTTGLPVHLHYFTAFVDDEGKMQLRDDIYGHSRKVQAALGL